MESDVLEKLASAIKGLGVPEPLDGRGLMATNPDGKQWKSRDIGSLKGLVWHQGLGWGSVEAVAKYHTSKNSHLKEGGVESIAYTWAIRRNGQIVLCNDFSKATWSQGFRGRTGDENAEFMSVMFEGLFHGEHVTDPSAGDPNEEQFLAGLVLWRVCRNVWGWQSDDLYGHYHFGKPSCPGAALSTVIDAVRVNAPKPAYDFGKVHDRQQALKTLGYYTAEVDGQWGAMSKGALINFQADHGLAADGVWGPRTQAAMNKALREI